MYCYGIKDVKESACPVAPHRVQKAILGSKILPRLSN